MTSSSLGSLREKRLLAKDEGYRESPARAQGVKMTEIPEQWKLLKLDLFDNATPEQSAENKQVLKLAISIQKQDSGDWMYYRAKLNSPFRNVRRGVTDQHDRSHYKLLEKTYQDIRAEFSSSLVRINASKIYRKGYADTKRTIDGFSTILWRTEESWIATLLIKQNIYHYQLSGANLSKRSRNTGIIASKTISAYRGYDMASVDELL
jgi:hypothetical protein